MGLRRGSSACLVRNSKRAIFRFSISTQEEVGSNPMKRYSFEQESFLSYRDDQIQLPLYNVECINRVVLVEHSIMNDSHDLGELKNLYKALGHEYGVDHLLDAEAIFILHLLDQKLSRSIDLFVKNNPNEYHEKVCLDIYWKIREEFNIAKLQAQQILFSSKFKEYKSCPELIAFEFPRSSISK
jgi:hypothetical protein